MQQETIAANDPTQAVYCKYCSKPITQNDYFCPNCGKKLRSKPASLNILPLIWLFVLSAVFPPFGLGLTIRYIKDPNKNAKRVGWISLIVTITVIILTIFYTWIFFQKATEELNNQLGNYQL